MREHPDEFYWFSVQLKFDGKGTAGPSQQQRKRIEKRLSAMFEVNRVNWNELIAVRAGYATVWLDVWPARAQLDIFQSPDALLVALKKALANSRTRRVDPDVVISLADGSEPLVLNLSAVTNTMKPARG